MSLRIFAWIIEHDGHDTHGDSRSHIWCRVIDGFDHLTTRLLGQAAQHPQRSIAENGFWRTTKAFFMHLFSLFGL